MNTQYCSMAESFRSSPETIALLISSTPIQNKKFMNTQYCSMAESFRSAPETIALLISYTPIQNKKLKKKNIVNCKHDKGPKAGMRKESRRHTGF